MKNAFGPVTKRNLSDTLARRIRGLIRSGEFVQGDRLPPILEMARRFGVGHPTIREALKKLEATGVVEIRHGSGVYVTRSDDVLVLASRDYAGTVTKKLLLDLIRVRIPLEVQSVSDAVENGTPEHFEEMRRLLATAGANLENDTILNAVNMAFHRQIALASGNTVLTQMLDVLHELFTDEQRLIIDIFGSRKRDHEEHVGILEALEQRDGALAVRRMRTHLEGVQAAVLRWEPDPVPVG